MGKQIFCNSAVNMKNIVAVGFDMDYTLAQYKPERGLFIFILLIWDGIFSEIINAKCFIQIFSL